MRASPAASTPAPQARGGRSSLSPAAAQQAAARRPHRGRSKGLHATRVFAHASPRTSRAGARAAGVQPLPVAATAGASTSRARRRQARLGQISDITKVVSPDTFERPIYAGNAIATVQSLDAIKVITVRTTGFDPAPADGGSGTVESPPSITDSGKSSFVGSEIVKLDRPELTSAKIIVSGGRALGSSDKFNEILTPLADKLGAALGASRAAVDAGYAPNDWQVGQTGKTSRSRSTSRSNKPARYSICGRKDSKVIVPSKGSEAPISASRHASSRTVTHSRDRQALTRARMQVPPPVAAVSATGFFSPRRAVAAAAQEQTPELRRPSATCCSAESSRRDAWSAAGLRGAGLDTRSGDRGMRALSRRCSRRSTRRRHSPSTGRTAS